MTRPSPDGGTANIGGAFDDDPDFDDEPCWNCGGEGCVAHCVTEYACVDPEEGCDLCIRTCNICDGEG